MRKPCDNCRCLLGKHGTDIEPIKLANGSTWFRYLHPCLTEGCHCADYKFTKGITYGYGKGDGIYTDHNVGDLIRHLERMMA